MPRSRRQKQPKGYEDRTRLDDEARERAAGLSAMTSNPGRRELLRRLGVDEETLRSAAGAKAAIDALINAPAEIAGPLAPLGWIPFGDVPLNDYRTAASLVEEGRIEEADELLTVKWNDGHRLARGRHRMSKLYFGDAEREAIGRHRARLLRKALDLHEAGQYAASIPVVLAQIDGLFLDATGQDAMHFFERRNQYLVDDETLAGHPDGLKALAKLMARTMNVTAATGKLSRHGILHGRELAYDTLTNSTKAFVALLAVVEWADPKLRVMSEAAAAAREARYAGSKEVGEDGRRLDRRWFPEAKEALLHTSSFQFGYFKRNGRYATNRAELDPGDRIPEVLGLQIATSSAGDEFWAWIRTPSGVVFGTAGRGGDFVAWLYVGEEEPGEIDSGTDWRHSATEPSHIDW